MPIPVCNTPTSYWNFFFTLFIKRRRLFLFCSGLGVDFLNLFQKKKEKGRIIIFNFILFDKNPHLFLYFKVNIHLNLHIKLITQTAQTSFKRNLHKKKKKPLSLNGPRGGGFPTWPHRFLSFFRVHKSKSSFNDLYMLLLTLSTHLLSISEQEGTLPRHIYYDWKTSNLLYVNFQETCRHYIKKFLWRFMTIVFFPGHQVKVIPQRLVSTPLNTVPTFLIN